MNYNIRLPLMCRSHDKLCKLTLMFGADGIWWQIKAVDLPNSDKIPDQTIIMVHLLGLVESVEGGSRLELPSIILRDDMLSLVASEEDLYEQLVKV